MPNVYIVVDDANHYLGCFETEDLAVDSLGFSFRKRKSTLEVLHPQLDDTLVKVHLEHGAPLEFHVLQAQPQAGVRHL